MRNHEPAVQSSPELWAFDPCLSPLFQADLFAPYGLSTTLLDADVERQDRDLIDRRA
jgi:hypothetical protein